MNLTPPPSRPPQISHQPAQGHPAPGSMQGLPMKQPLFNAPQAMPVQPYPMPLPVQNLIYQLGSQTTMAADGNVRLNAPLIETIVRYREQAVPVLCQFMSNTQNMLSMVEALYTSQRLAEERVSNVPMLYGVTQHWNNNPHPLVQIYLAGFYRKLNAPHTLGPMLSMMMRNALQPGPPIPSAFNPQEEIGGTVLDLIANKSADETMKRLVPYLQSMLNPSQAPMAMKQPIAQPRGQ